MNPQQVGRAGELYVAAEIHRRGGYTVTFAGNMPGIIQTIARRLGPITVSVTGAPAGTLT